VICGEPAATRVELVCGADGTGIAGMYFVGNGLHPGTAVVTITITHGIDDTVVARDSRKVRIPAGYNQP
jgi:hypothetical protein